MVPPYAIDINDITEVTDAIRTAFAAVGGEGSFALIDRVVADVTEMFGGGFAGYQAIDMEYHDLDHTFQVTICMIRLLKGRYLAGAKPILGRREWEMALVSALLHDTGFLKKIGDDEGTGAKYTFVHEKRSCAFARKYLPDLDFTSSEIEDICATVMCTGPRNHIGNVSFRREEVRQIALLLVTADYLAQMSAPDYLEKLPRLYLEFEEAFAKDEVPLEDRPYKNLDQLLETTPVFWTEFVLPLLNGEAEGVFRYLSPGETANPYLVAISENLAELKRRLEAESR